MEGLLVIDFGIVDIRLANVRSNFMLFTNLQTFSFLKEWGLVDRMASSCLNLTLPNLA